MEPNLSYRKLIHEIIIHSVPGVYFKPNHGGRIHVEQSKAKIVPTEFSTVLPALHYRLVVKVNNEKP